MIFHPDNVRNIEQIQILYGQCFDPAHILDDIKMYSNLVPYFGCYHVTHFSACQSTDVPIAFENLNLNILRKCSLAINGSNRTL